jgi:predicted Rossmann-fold nucleotide-binding protein
MAEFVNGYETMGRIGPCVSILDQLEQNQKTSIINLLKVLPSKSVKLVMVITGGGPGIMEAGNKAHLAEPVGLNIVYL